MLKLRYRRLHPVTSPSPSAHHADLEIRNLLEYPALRAAMGLDEVSELPVPTLPWPAPLFDRRRLLQNAAA